MPSESLRKMYDTEVQDNFVLRKGLPTLTYLRFIYLWKVYEKLCWRSELNKKTMEIKNLEYKCLVAEEKIEQLQKENRKLKENTENMKQVNSGEIFYSWKRLTFWVLDRMKLRFFFRKAYRATYRAFRCWYSNQWFPENRSMFTNQPSDQSRFFYSNKYPFRKGIN